MFRWPNGRLEKLKPRPPPSEPQLAARSISETRSASGSAGVGAEWRADRTGGLAGEAAVLRRERAVVPALEVHLRQLLAQRRAVGRRRPAIRPRARSRSSRCDRWRCGARQPASGASARTEARQREQDGRGGDRAGDGTTKKELRKRARHDHLSFVFEVLLAARAAAPEPAGAAATAACAPTAASSRCTYRSTASRIAYG